MPDLAAWLKSAEELLAPRTELRLICDFPENWDTSQGDGADWCQHGRRYPHHDKFPVPVSVDPAKLSEAVAILREVERLNEEAIANYRTGCAHRTAKACTECYRDRCEATLDKLEALFQDPVNLATKDRTAIS